MEVGLGALHLSTEQPERTIVRETPVAGHVVLVGGVGGCGKSLVSPVISTFGRVEMQKYDYQLEHVCSLAYLGKLDRSAATAMIRMLTDLDLYNLMISRDTNLRFSDYSSIWLNPHPLRYLWRLCQPGDGPSIIQRIRDRQPILLVLMHHLLMLSPALLAALGDRAKIIEVIRHPLYMIRQLYDEVYRTDERAFTIFFEHQGQPVPFFAKGWEETYLASNRMDKAIHYIAECWGLNERLLRGLSAQERSQVLMIPFERLVLDPGPILADLEQFLGTRMTPTTRRELKRQRVPRKRIADSLPLPIYKRCGWQPPQSGSTEREELDLRRRYTAKYATPEGMRLMDQICARYEAMHMRGLL